MSENVPNIVGQLPILVDESPTTEGLKVTLSIGPERKPIIPIKDPSKILTEEKGRLITYPCGHRGHKTFEMFVYGAAYRPEKPRDCPDCARKWFERHAIRCCLCGLAIIPGDGVAVYDRPSVVNKDFEFLVVNDGRTAIGCMRWDCCSSGGFFAGNLAENHQIDYRF